jgi:hypothetical protein
VSDTSFFLKHSLEPWATWFFRALWLVLLISLVWVGFALYAIGCAAVELYHLESTVQFAPGVMLAGIALVFGIRALAMLTQIPYWRFVLWEANRKERMSAYSRWLRTQISIEDESA